MVVRDSLKVLMAVLALVGITGMYLRQVRQIGVLGLIGYVLFGAGYLVIMCTSFVAAYVLPSIAATDPSYVNDVTRRGHQRPRDRRHRPAPAGASRSRASATWLGGLVFGIALYRARVLARWAAALLAVGGVVSAALAVMPDAFYRLLAFPNGIAMIALGYSLWLVARADAGPGRPRRHPAAAHGRRRMTLAGLDHAAARRHRSPRPGRERRRTGWWVPAGLARAGRHPGRGRHRPARRGARRPGGPADRRPLRRLPGPARRAHRGRRRLRRARRLPVLRAAAPPPTRAGTAEQDGSWWCWASRSRSPGLWMTLAYPRKEGTGDLLWAVRLLVGSGMGASLVLGARRHPQPRHRPAPGLDDPRVRAGSGRRHPGLHRRLRRGRSSVRASFAPTS